MYSHYHAHTEPEHGSIMLSLFIHLFDFPPIANGWNWVVTWSPGRRINANLAESLRLYSSSSTPADCYLLYIYIVHCQSCSSSQPRAFRGKSAKLMQLFMDIPVRHFKQETTCFYGLLCITVDTLNAHFKPLKMLASWFMHVSLTLLFRS